jgi:ankyrin repeat protein
MSEDAAAATGSTGWEEELHLAVRDNAPEKVLDILSREEVRRNGDLGREEWQGPMSPLQFAAFWGDTKIVQLLVEGGVNVNSFVKFRESNNRCTALHWAIYKDRPSMVQLLLDLGADPELKGKRGDLSGTPLDWAKTMGFGESVKILENFLSGDQD